MSSGDEIALLNKADMHAAAYLRSVEKRRVFPTDQDIKALSALSGPLPVQSADPSEMLALFNKLGTLGTVTSNGPNYYGFVIGAVLPAVAAVDRLASAWDQCASSHVNSPVMAEIEKTAATWLLEILDLPSEAGVGFGTSATACGLACLATARAALLARLGWDVEARGLSGAPQIRVVISETAHVTVKKALRVLGFGSENFAYAAVDNCGRILPDQLPELTNRTILCLQAGEVNTGEFDPFVELIEKARKAGAWVHVDGAFGLWARASNSKRSLTDGIEDADSWTTDGHKWLNTSYDCAVSICKDKSLLAKTMNANAEYSNAEDDAQKNLTLEFSRKGRGLGVWAALRSLGRVGVENLVDQYCQRASQLAEGCRTLGIPVVNRVVLNQVLCAFDDENSTQSFVRAVQERGKIWFGPTKWNNKAAFRLSVSSWRTEPKHIEACISELAANL